jgi:PKD repeat protein
MGEMSFEWKDMLGNTLTFRKRTSGTDTLKNLAPGYYYVTATGKNKMCPALTEEIEVNRAPELTLIPVITNNACKNEKNGVINASHAFGGTAPYYYKWSNNTYKPVLKDLTSGVYTLVLIDSQGCTDTTYHVIKTMSPVHADFKITTDTATILEGQPVVFSSQSTGQTSLTWDFGTEVSSLSNPTVSFSVPGTHTIELVASDNQCSSVSQKVIQVKKKPSVTPKDLIDEVMIYHSGENNASVKFNFEEPSESIVSVYSIEGKILNTQTVTAWKNTEVVPLGESHGVYIVSVSSHGNYFQNKIIK